MLVGSSGAPLIFIYFGWRSASLNCPSTPCLPHPSFNVHPTCTPTPIPITKNSSRTSRTFTASNHRGVSELFGQNRWLAKTTYWNSQDRFGQTRQAQLGCGCYTAQRCNSHSPKWTISRKPLEDIGPTRQNISSESVRPSAARCGGPNWAVAVTLLSGVTATAQTGYTYL